MKNNRRNIALDEDKIRSIVHNNLESFINENEKDEGFSNKIKKWLDKLNGRYNSSEGGYDESEFDNQDDDEETQNSNDYQGYSMNGNNYGGISDNPNAWGEISNSEGYESPRQEFAVHNNDKEGTKTSDAENNSSQESQNNIQQDTTKENKPNQEAQHSYQRGSAYQMEFRHENEEAFNNVIVPAYKSITSAIKSLTALENLDYLKVSPSIWNWKGQMTGGGQKEAREVKEEIAKILPVLNYLKVKMKTVLYANGIQQTTDYQHYGMEEQRKVIKNAVMEELQNIKHKTHDVIDEETLMRIAKNVKTKFINESKKHSNDKKIDKAINISIDNICKKVFE